MSYLWRLGRALGAWWPVVLVLVLSGFLMRVSFRLLFGSGGPRSGEFRLSRYAALVSLSGACLVAVILAAPVSDATHGQLLSFVGILLSAAIALSSTTLVGNVMAGVMLRSIRSFRPGDFIQMGEVFGRVTEIGLFHTEIQTEFRDLCTVPHLHLVQQPVKVVQSCGTVVAAVVSIGYDVSRHEVEAALHEAAVETGLRDPFVRILELGDFSVTYQAAGFLEDVKILLTARSKLRGFMMDRLHQRRIEIVSPSFVNQRIFAKEEIFLNQERLREPTREVPALTPESMIFDKADAAETREQILETLESIDQRVIHLEEQDKLVRSVELKRQIQREVKRLRDLEGDLGKVLEQKTVPVDLADGDPA